MGDGTGHEYTDSTVAPQPLLLTMGDTMHTVIVTIKVQPGKTQQVLDALAASLPDTRKYAGCQLVETYVDEDDPTTIILWEKWDVRESQGKYMAWRSSLPGDPKLAEALAAAPTFTHYTLKPGV